MRQRRWGVYEATGASNHPLRFLACVESSAKSTARGQVHRMRNIPNRDLVVVEGCPRRAHATLYGARRRRRR